MTATMGEKPTLPIAKAKAVPAISPAPNGGRILAAANALVDGVAPEGEVAHAVHKPVLRGSDAETHPIRYALYDGAAVAGTGDGHELPIVLDIGRAGSGPGVGVHCYRSCDRRRSGVGC